MLSVTPLERAARELCKLDGKDPGHPPFNTEEQPFRGPDSTEPNWKSYVDQARAVLSAIREPSEAMINAVPGDRNAPIYPEDIWQAMIDAALAEG